MEKVKFLCDCCGGEHDEETYLCSCGGNVYSYRKCECCGEWILDGFDLFSSDRACKACVRKMFSWERFKKFLEEEKLEADFYISYYFQTEVKGEANEELVALCKEKFWGRMKLLFRDEDAAGSILDFLTDNESEFADWLEEEVRISKLCEEAEK